MTPLDLFLATLLVGFSAILVVVALMAYRARRERRLAFLAMAFLLLLAMAVGALAGGLLNWTELKMGTFSLVLGLGVMGCMYLAILRK
ncbi:MAG: hypothetical protein WCK39_02620 [Methanomassiliicoccales archaeon]